MKKSIFALAIAAAATNAFADIWEHIPSFDPMTDRDRSLAAIMVDRGTMIAVRCNGSTDFDIIVRPGGHISSRDSAATTYRIDQQEPVQSSWNLSTDGQAVFVPDRLKVEFLGQLKAGGRLVVQVRDFRGTPITAIYPLAGSTAAINQLSCTR